MSERERLEMEIQWAEQMIEKHKGEIVEWEDELIGLRHDLEELEGE